MNYFSSSEGKHTPEQSRKRSRETLTSCFRAANIFIQEDNHEITQKMGLSWAGPWKSWCTVIIAREKSLHPHIIPRKRREAGCVSAGTAARNEKVGVSLMKRMILCFPVSYTSKYSTCSAPAINFTSRHIILWTGPSVVFVDVHMHPQRSVNKCWRGGVIKGRRLFLSHMRNHTRKKKKKVSGTDAHTANTAPNEQSNNN